MIALGWRDLLGCLLVLGAYHLIDRVLYGLAVTRALGGTTLGGF